jgi:hypothetical protein
VFVGMWIVGQRPRMLMLVRRGCQDVSMHVLERH